MWGHPQSCQCALCQSLRRALHLVESGCGLPGFDAFCTSRARVLEGELRDELNRIGRVTEAPVGFPTPRAPYLPAFLPPPFVRVPFVPATGPAEAQCKAVPPPPPPQAVQRVEVKKESEQDQGESLQEVPQVESLPKERKEKKKDRSRSRRRRKSRSHSHRRRKEREAERPKSSRERQGRFQSPKGEEGSPKKAEEKKEEEKGDTASPKAEGSQKKGEPISPKEKAEEKKGREKSDSPKSSGKRKREEETEEIEEETELTSERKQRPEDKRRPAEPKSSPLGLQRTPPRPQGPGWRGPLPQYPPGRWDNTKNKGQVKRAKQFLHAERRREGHHSHSSSSRQWRPRGR